MTEHREMFADGLGQIHFAGGMVRMDFMTLQPGEAGQEASPRNSFRIIMPTQGFLGAFNSMQQLIDEPAAAGIVRKQALGNAFSPQKSLTRPFRRLTAGRRSGRKWRR